MINVYVILYCKRRVKNLQRSRFCLKKLYGSLGTEIVDKKCRKDFFLSLKKSK